MRHPRSAPTLLSLLAIVLSTCPFAVAKPYPRDGPLEKRCASPCGWQGQLCCTASQQCATDAAGQAQCVSSGAAAAQVGGAGQWQYYTTTWVETGFVTRVSTYSSYVGAVATAQAVPTVAWQPTVTSQASQCSIPCGGICCAHGQYCQVAGQCAAVAAQDFSAAYYTSVVYGAAFSSAESYVAPLRPTSGGPAIATSIAGFITATVPFQTPVGTAGSLVFSAVAATDSGLSGGAIAGIVIGVLAAILLLLFLIFALCFRGTKKLVGGRKREETTYVEHRHSRNSGRKWYGGAQASSSRPPPKKSGPGMGGVLAGLGALALALGLKRKYDNRKDDVSTTYGSETTYYTGTYDYTSSSK